MQTQKMDLFIYCLVDESPIFDTKKHFAKYKTVSVAYEWPTPLISEKKVHSYSMTDISIVSGVPSVEGIINQGSNGCILHILFCVIMSGV